MAASSSRASNAGRPPCVFVAAPRGDAVKIADVVDLRQREKLFPVERERILNEAADFELPIVQRDFRLLAQVEHGPVLYFVLADREVRHPVPVRVARALRPFAGELNVHDAFVQGNLTLDVPLSPFDKI